MTDVSKATTLPMSAARAARGKALLLPQQVVASPATQLRYRVDSLLGQGGFGQAYLATRLTRSRDVPRVVALKASEHIDGWVREAYFGRILEGNARAIRVYDAFPLTREDGSFVYCLALEWARHGDLRAFLERTRKGWAERTARREIAGILQVLGSLHRGQMLHRDLTPMNVFVCDDGTLKLGDFGIVRHASDRRGVRTRTLNPWGAPSEIRDAAAPKWQARDDVYQVGQLIAMLLKGTAKARIRPGEVRRFRCTDHLKEIVYRCIGERGKRYESAGELIEALTHPPAPLKVGRLRTLEGAHLAFTGILSRTRREAARAARRAGATVHGSPSARTNVVVRGRPNPLQAAGRDAGRKLIEIKRLREKGHRITLLNEKQFWRLVGR
ncbi:MAG TPA: protein kinase [Thermoanaerobaculia bacterium]|nr:protein kinase [Thermoanaerobaculia bacterium]